MSGKRQPHSHRKPLQIGESWDKIINIGEDLKILRSLSDAHLRSVTEAVKILKTVHTSSKRQKYQLFLCNVLRKCGSHGVLVCAIALGQVKVVNMKNCDRVGLLRKLENNRDSASISHPTLRSLAARYKVPSSVDGIYPHLTFLKGLTS